MILLLQKNCGRNPENIINMEENTLNYNMPSNKTIHKKGAKNIIIKAQN